MIARSIPAPKTTAITLLIVLHLAAVRAVALQEFAISDFSSPDEITAGQLAESIRTTEARTDLDETTRADVVEQLRDAEARLQNRTSAETAAAAYTEALDSAPAETDRLRASLDVASDPPSAESLGIDDDTALTEFERMLTQAAADLAAADTGLSDLDSQIAAQEARPVTIRERINELRISNEQLAVALEAPPAPGDPAVLTDARALATQLHQSANAAEITMLENELLSHTVRLDLLRAQRDVAARTRADLNRRTIFIQERANAARQASALLAQQTTAAAALEAVDNHPAVQEIAAGNAALTEELPRIAVNIEELTAQLGRVIVAAEDIETRFAGSRQRLEIGGVSRVIGRILIAESRNLPQVSQYRSAVQGRQKTLADIGLAQIRIQEQRRELTPLDARVEQVMTVVALDTTNSEELAYIESQVQDLLRDRRELLNQVENIYRSYLHALGDLDAAQRRLLDVSASYNEFLRENLLWIPSAPLIGTGSWQEVVPAMARVLSPASWATALNDTRDSLLEHRAVTLFITLLVLALILARRALNERSAAMNSKVGRLSTDHIGLTLGVIAIAILSVLPLPLLLGLFSWTLERGELPAAFSLAVAGGLSMAAPFLFNVLLFRAITAKDGVADVHFGWREEALVLVRRQLNRLLVIGIPLAFVTVVLYDSSIASDRATLGRVTYVAMMVIYALLIKPLAHPESGIVANYYQRQPSNWISRGRWIWYVVAVGGPLLLSLAAVIGYIYASGVLTGLLVRTIWLMLGIIVVGKIVLRWLVLTRRKIAWQMAIKKREAQKTAGLEEPASPQGEGDLPAIESAPLNLDAVDQQTRRLLRSGLFLVGVLAAWSIWAEVLPALNLLDQLPLWSQTVTLDGVVTIAPVTLADLLLAMLVAAVTFVASKNLPGLMEIAVLQRLTLQPGSRYAINTLVRYFVVSVGVITCFSIVGWDWSQIQWLVAALSVGLGFGLQEIVANFVSGLVILFERPVRVGDTVTVGQLTGVVSQVRIRATTITDWDNKEILVPNKSFITEQVVNWTLSDPITRIVIPVGIAYGSDVVLARQVMEDTLRSLPILLEDPPPSVYFVGFGDSSLNFRLNMYLRDLDDRLPLTHAVHEAILAALRENDISIPFPQRDLHVRSIVRNDNDLPDEAS